MDQRFDTLSNCVRLISHWQNYRDMGEPGRSIAEVRQAWKVHQCEVFVAGEEKDEDRLHSKECIDYQGQCEKFPCSRVLFGFDGCSTINPVEWSERKVAL